MIRYRREVITRGIPYVEYIKEEWEPVEESKNSSFMSGKRLKVPFMATYKDTLNSYELWAIQNDWEPPGYFTYVTELPSTAIEITTK